MFGPERLGEMDRRRRPGGVAYPQGFIAPGATSTLLDTLWPEGWTRNPPAPAPSRTEVYRSRRGRCERS